ncbi:hypothetical protein [Niastella populi]|uniref:Uncharacterized protein n=1 Tax=Niastella populi TaxID=550983 RepID=A0A1V9G1Q5_9BACT|nr:hypothetical protein [Niastella populi]OQP64575.1 hypothetical protein A4R26_16125 [Niastella populi]
MEQYIQTAPSNTESNLFELQIDHEVSSHLRETAKWAKFLSIVGFVALGFILLIVIFAGSMASYSAYSSPLSAAFGYRGIFQVVLLLAMVVLYFMPCLFMFKFSNKMLQALGNNDQETLIASFRQLKLCYKYIGILTLVLISLYALIFVIGLVFAVSR